MNLFGNHFNWRGLAGIYDFYLKYGVYLLYKDGNRDIHFKSLQDDSKPTILMSNCGIFVARGNSVVLTIEEDNSHSIFLWTSDEKFKKIYQSKEEITMIEFGFDTHVLAVQLARHKLLLFRVEDKNLFPFEGRESWVSDVLLSGKDMFYVWKSSQGIRIESHCAPSMDQSITAQPDDSELDTKATDSTKTGYLDHFGGEYFLWSWTRAGAVSEIVLDFPSLDETKKLLTGGEFYALSE